MRIAVIAVAILGCIALERTARFRYRDRPFFRDYFTTDIVYIATAFAFGTWLSVVYLVPVSRWLDATLPIPRLTRLDWSLWVLVPLAVALIDFGNWFAHYILHRSDTLWRLHKVHHSTHVLDWLSTFRSHVLEQVLRDLIWPISLLVLGVPMEAVLLGAAIYGGFAIFNHSNTQLNLRFLEPAFITPRLHHIHHSPGNTCQKNFGTVFSLWDRLARTFAKEAPEPERYGVPGELDTYPQTWRQQFVEPFRSTPSPGTDSAN